MFYNNWVNVSTLNWLFCVQLHCRGLIGCPLFDCIIVDLIQGSYYYWVVFHRRMSHIKIDISLRIFFHQREPSIKGCIPSKGPSRFIFHGRLSSISSHLLSKGVFHWMLSSIKSHLRLSFNHALLPSQVFFHRKLSPFKDFVPSKVVSHQRFLPLKAIFYQSQSSIQLSQYVKFQTHSTIQSIKITAKAVYGRAESRNLSIGSHLPSKGVFH